MTIIYEIPDEFAPQPHYRARKDEAIALARLIADITGQTVNVIMHETAPLQERDLVIALLTSIDWSGKTETVFTAKPRTTETPANSEEPDAEHTPDSTQSGTPNNDDRSDE